MAGDWIKFEVGTHDKPEVWAIADALDIDPDAVVGKLMKIWAWFDQHTEEGNAPTVSKKLLDRLVSVTGFCDATILAGWMVDKDGFLSLPNFERHNGKTAKTRAVTAKRVAAHKVRAANGDSVTEALPKEEKRREEKRREEVKSKDSDAGASGGKPPKQKLAKTDLVNELQIPEDVAEAWLEIRKAKKSPLTRVAMQSLINEFSKAGLSVPDGIRLCTERGWVGFKASWDWQERKGATQHTGFSDREYTERIPDWAQKAIDEESGRQA